MAKKAKEPKAGKAEKGTASGRQRDPLGAVTTLVAVLFAGSLLVERVGG